MSIEAIIFDVGGVLVRNQDRRRRRNWEVRLGLPERELFRIVFGSQVARDAMIGRATEDDVWRFVGETLKLDSDQLRDLRTDFWYDEELDVELAQFMRALRVHYQVAILSIAFNNARAALTQAFGISDAADLMIFSAEVGLAKPDPFYQLACKRSNIAPEQAVFVDDSMENVQSAQALGIHAIQFIDTRQAIAEVNKHLE